MSRHFRFHDDEDDHSGSASTLSFGSHPFSLNSDLIYLGFDSLANARPGGGGSGGGGSGGGGSGSTTTTYTSGDKSTADSQEYNIQVVFKGTDWTLEPQGQAPVDAKAIFMKSADLITSWIAGDVQDVLFRGKVIDDLSITVELVNIDGPGGILGQAGPVAIRTSGHLPATAVIQLDVADATDYAAAGTLDDIVLHEMLHSVGFGSVWSYFDGLVVDGMFLGDSATAAYGDNPIPVEQDGGSGTAGSHWDEATFQTELMTGYIGYLDTSTNPDTYDPNNYLSYMTVASLGDLGYAMDSDLTGATYVTPNWI
jgi:hypothetical protein